MIQANRILDGAARRALSAGIALGAYGRRPGLVGGLLGLGVRQLNADAGPFAPRILTLPKGGFIEDVDAAFGDGDFTVLGLARYHTKALYGGFLPQWVDDNSYQSAPPEMDARKAALRGFWTQVWPRVQARAQASAVLTGNFAYAAEQDFGAVVEASGVPFIAMHKEALKTPGLVNFYTTLYRDRRQPFQGRKILVYNTIERGIQIDAGIIPPDRVEVCGMPRLDRLHQWRIRAAQSAAPSGRPLVLFLSFHPKTGLPVIPRKPGAAEGRLENLGNGLGDVSWHDLSAQCHHAVLRLARENPGIDVVVKGKGDLAKWLGLTGASIDQDRPDNLKLVVGGDPQDLIARASIVCGFTTTALLEAIASGKPVVVPRFAEALDDASKPFFLDLGDAVDHAASADDLYDRLLAGAVPPVAPPANLSDHAADMLDHWAGNPDGKAGDRVRAAVMAEIGRGS
ncbi:MAG: hypothetical protein HOB82_07200 [Alphaproteobacteria bacterium]|nr:hypothetical protein [Alphaproteobacteria bacterium]